MERFIFLLERFNKTAVIALRCLWQQKMRSALSILGVVCGVMTVLAMLGAGEGAKRKILVQIQKLGITNVYIKNLQLSKEQAIRAAEMRSRGLSIEDMDRIASGCRVISKIAGLKEVAASVLGMPRELSPQICAVTSNYAEIQNIKTAKGRLISEMDISQKSLVCILGSDIAVRLGIGGNPGQNIRIEEHLFRIVGILDKMDYQSQDDSAIAIRNFNNMLFIPIGTENLVDKSIYSPVQENGLNPSLENASSNLSEIVIQVKNAEAIPHAALLLRRIMEVSHNKAEDYQIIIPLELLKQSQKTQRTLNTVLGAIACVSLLVGGIGIMNIMLATVSERTREIGIRRAVGATRTNIIFQFLTEAVILTLSGGIIGIILGMAGVWLVADIGQWNIIITPWSFALPLVMSLLVGIFFGLYPAYRAARMNPVNAFRHE